jgi:EAL and modified HD-GYP domain-containing signal transduction protein
MLDALEIALARQPIFDRDDHLVGYELLYRRSQSDAVALQPEQGSGIQMSSDTITGAFVGLGVERVTGGKRAFINLDRALLLSGSAYVLDPNAVVLEILETVRPDPEVVDACKALVDGGYELALDDFVYEPAYDPLLRLAKIVKVDVLDRPMCQLRDQLDRLRPFGAMLLAERVESRAVRDECAALGFEFFQGYYFARPETLASREVPVEQANLMRLLNLLRDPDTTDGALEDVFRADVRLTYRLLRIVNSASMGHTGVTSIGHGIRLLGRATLHRWMSLLLVSSLVTRTGGARDELVELALIRARFSELLMEALGRGADTSGGFVAGLFSLLDALLQMPMAEVVERVSLTPELRDALLDRRGPFAPTLRVIDAYEGARDAEEMFGGGDANGVALDALPGLYLQSVEWARSTLCITAA